MKDYKLLNNQEGFLGHNWTKTYLTELNSKVLTLFNYTNYFIPDFLKDFSDENHLITSYKDLQYHHWHRVTDEDISRIGEDALLGAKAGYALISYARNENDFDKNTGSIREDSSYYSAVPAAWSGFYDMYIDNYIMYFNYDQYAEEKYGRKNLLYNVDLFPSRFFSTYQNSNHWLNLAKINGTMGITLYARLLPDATQGEIICDRQSHNWTNIQSNPVMGFTYYQTEEIILDTDISFSRVAKTNIAAYTITRKNPDMEIAPQNTYVALI